MILYLLLSTLTGAVEIGSLFYGMRSGLPLWAMLIFPLCYQLGNLLFIPKYFSERMRILVLFTAAVFLGLSAYSGTIIAFGGLLVFTSLVLQLLRFCCKGTVPTWLKRCFRVAGFLLSPVFCKIPLLFVCVILLIACFAAFAETFHRDKEADEKEPCGYITHHRLSGVMLLHQMHYFVYSYTVCAAAVFVIGSMKYTAAAFALTWLVYIIPDFIAGHISVKIGTKAYRRIFFSGHIFVTIVLLLMAYAHMHDMDGLFIVLWILTGLGGGTVFCIKHLGIENDVNRDLSENLGHVLGVAAAMATAFVLPRSEILVSILLGAVFAAGAIITVAVKIKKEEKLCVIKTNT